MRGGRSSEGKGVLENQTAQFCNQIASINKRKLADAYLSQDYGSLTANPTMIQD